MAYAITEIITTLRNARHRKGLSQTELGRRVSLPQSHISKIENGGSDLKLSSVIEIARALDLEVKLIPRSAIPAVESIGKAAATESFDETKRALDRIRWAEQIAERLSRAPPLNPHLAELRRTLDELRPFRFNHASLKALSDALTPIEHVRKRTDQLDIPPERLGNLASAYIHPITKSADSLKALRNRLAHSATEPAATQRPAYRLDDEDD